MQDEPLPYNPNSTGEKLKRAADVALAATWGFITGLAESSWNLYKQTPFAAPVRVVEVVLDKDPTRNFLEKAGYVLSPQGHALATVAGNRYAFLVDQNGFDPTEAVPCVVAAALGDVLGPTPFVEGILDFDFSYNIGQELEWDDQFLRTYTGGTSMLTLFVGGRGPAPRVSKASPPRIRPPGAQILPEIAVPGDSRTMVKVNVIGERIEVRKLNWRERRRADVGNRHLMSMRVLDEDFNWLQDRTILSGKNGALAQLGSEQASCGLGRFCTEATATRLVESLPEARIVKLIGSKPPCPFCQIRLATSARVNKIMFIYEEQGKNLWAFVPRLLEKGMKVRPLPIKPK